MKPRIAWVWCALVLCAAIVIAAMTAMTRGVMAAERERQKAQQERSAAESRADLEERTRLALWRMDALGAAIVLRENSIPLELYQGHQTPDPQPDVHLHFEIRKDADVTSSEYRQTPHGTMAERMEKLRALLAANPLPGNEWTQLNEAVIEGENAWKSVPKEALKEQSYNSQQRMMNQSDELRKDGVYQSFSNVSERAQRAKAVEKTIELPTKKAAAPVELKSESPSNQAAGAAFSDSSSSPSPVTDTGPMRPVWLGGELFLLRPVYQTLADGKELNIAIQGAWLDSEKLRTQLLEGIQDLLPNAKLLPATGERAAEDPLTMVSFPFRLERHEIIAAPFITTPKSSLGKPLWIAWIAVALAVITTTLLIRGIMRLSERRASFVSAVTHELRTPLTTFRLYSDMLESGAVKPEKRGDYLRVLSREADRLSHLVENVLAFSRIERGNARSNVRDISVGDLLEQSRERLEARLATAGLQLEMETSSTTQVRADTAAVEHILFNLIDNAAKYASNSSPAIVEIQTHDLSHKVEIHITDHGPGIAPNEVSRIFRAFHKSAHEAAESQPGVGLGLALSRRLAREQGGDLTCQSAPTPSPGARFILQLPRTTAS